VAKSPSVDAWFAKNTFHADEFNDVEELVELKQAQGISISLGLPTLNEAETIGNVIDIIKASLFDNFPLLDEISVIDSDSTDCTVAIAESYGVAVINDYEVLPEWGANAGKGAALWKSLIELKGDIIVWVDTDIKNIHPRFVYGLVGPLLKYPHLKYTKGFYKRPLSIGDRYIETGGGRVTELTARPLLNMFYPELSGLVQPLSGEYAGRRELLERIGFFNGYGVEIGHLIDIVEQFGLDVIAQVDLIERVHRNQSLTSLSKMAFAILQVVMDSLEKKGAIELVQEMNHTIRLANQEQGRFYLEPRTIHELKKPPMITLQEYCRKFGKAVSFTDNLLPFDDDISPEFTPSM
jgi:glucosyl-3-phosphoglycerate synthase